MMLHCERQRKLQPLSYFGYETTHHVIADRVIISLLPDNSLGTRNKDPDSKYYKILELHDSTNYCVWAISELS